MERRWAKRLLWTGAFGYAVAALGFVTPMQVVILGMLGLDVVIAYLDYILLFVLALFGSMMAYALYALS